MSVFTRYNKGRKVREGTQTHMMQTFHILYTFSTNSVKTMEDQNLDALILREPTERKENRREIHKDRV